MLPRGLRSWRGAAKNQHGPDRTRLGSFSQRDRSHKPGRSLSGSLDESRMIVLPGRGDSALLAGYRHGQIGGVSGGDGDFDGRGLAERVTR